MVNLGMAYHCFTNMVYNINYHIYYNIYLYIYIQISEHSTCHGESWVESNPRTFPPCSTCIIGKESPMCNVAMGATRHNSLDQQPVAFRTQKSHGSAWPARQGRDVQDKLRFQMTRYSTWDKQNIPRNVYQNLESIWQLLASLICGMGGRVI